jgi:hypothetical protein
MISDVLSDALAKIDEYVMMSFMYSDPELRKHINKVRAEMYGLLAVLDAPPPGTGWKGAE